MQDADSLYDLTIIGGGPAGLFAAFYAGLRGMKTKIIDSLEELGGQLTALYPEKYIFDVAGFPKILARDLANNLIEQAMQYSPAVCLGQTAVDLIPVEGRQEYCIVTDKARHHTKAVLLCAGSGAFSPKKLPVPGSELCEKQDIYYFVKSKAIFAGKRLLIVGGGDSAVDWALNLQDTAAHITLIHRRNQFRAHEHSVRKLQATPTDILTFWELKSLHVVNDKLASALIFNNKSNEERTIQLDAILMQLGFTSSLGAIKNWPIKIDKAGIAVNGHMETNLPGVFAAGDVAAHEGKLKLIATGFSEACTAVNYAKIRIDPAAKFFPGHSSELSPHEEAVTV